MTPEIISFSVIASFLVILLFGFLFGLARGFNKSLVRAIIVIACLVITFFCVPSITKAAMNVNVANMNITVNGQVMNTLGEALSASLAEVPYIADLAQTQAFDTIITVVPQMIVNVVLFIVLFYVLRLISMIIYWIIAGICFSKKKTQGKSKHRLLGGLVGIVQNFVIFLVLLVPCVGVINLISDIDTNLPKKATATASQTTEISGSGDQTQGDTSGGNQNQDNQNNNNNSEDLAGKLNTTLTNVNEVVDAYKSTWVFKFLHGVKLDSACNYVFNKLSTVKVNKVSYNLHDEAISLTKVVVDFADVMPQDGKNLSFTDTETIDKLEVLINDAYKSKLTANLIDEVIPTAVKKWNAGETFMGITKPTMEGYEEVINDILAELGKPGSKKQLLLSTTKMAKSLVKTINTISNAEGEISLDNIATLLKDITSDANVMELAETIVVSNIKTIADKMFEGSKDNQYVGVVVEAVESIFGADYSLDGNNIDNEINVLSSTLKVADKLMNSEGGNKLTQEDANSVINALANSTVIFDTLTKTKDDQTTSDITKTLQDVIGENEEAKTMLTTAIDSLENVSEDKVNKLKEIFNLSNSTSGDTGNTGDNTGNTETGEGQAA